MARRLRRVEDARALQVQEGLALLSTSALAHRREEVPSVDAVVVDHKVGELLLLCVESLMDAGAANVVVVDNAVPPGSSARALAGAGGVTIIETGSNLGYGSGANRGVAACSAEFVMLCNPDADVDPHTLARLAEVLTDDPTLAIVGPRVNEPDGTRYPSARKFPSLLEGVGHALAGLLAPRNRLSRSYLMEDLDEATDPTRVDWVSGSCMLVRRRAYEELGGFDEAYFMYAEDVDICWRAHRVGWGVAYVPDATITHHGGVSAGRRPYKMLVSHHRSTLRFANRTLSGPKRLALPAVAIALFVRLGAEMAKQALSQDLLPVGRHLTKGTPPDG